ncbi:MAG: 3-deoxy-D-manno-octulosonic acid transferase, partial [Caulobacteraceae bacterium]|nr:3-deoxy-D-manno-octulosonic acid transferase [Caulobacteraceae bacterium]
SDGAAPEPGGDIYIADTLGELGLFFRLADLAVIGGSFVDGIGGHNPLEPARLGKAALHGPFFSNWASVYASLGEGAVACADGASLASQLTRLLADPAEAIRLGEAAQAAAHGHDQVLDALMLKLSPLLPA